MYRRHYAEMSEEASHNARRRERTILESAVTKLREAKLCGARTPESFEATAYVRQLWTVFISDLSSDENALPIALRASLISIGIWVRREVDRIDSGQSENFDGLIEINQMIADGLV
jgi:flagellar biosynthesis activator protein FlaF